MCSDVTPNSLARLFTIWNSCHVFLLLLDCVIEIYLPCCQYCNVNSFSSQAEAGLFHLVPHKPPISEWNQLIRTVIYVWPAKEFLMAHNIFVSSKNNWGETRWPIEFPFCWLNLLDFCSSQSRWALLGSIKVFFLKKYIILFHFQIIFQHEL